MCVTPTDILVIVVRTHILPPFVETIEPNGPNEREGKLKGRVVGEVSRGSWFLVPDSSSRERGRERDERERRDETR